MFGVEGKLAAKTPMDVYSNQAFNKMKDCLHEFQIKKKDTVWVAIMNRIREHIY